MGLWSRDIAPLKPPSVNQDMNSAGESALKEYGRRRASERRRRRNHFGAKIALLTLLTGATFVVVRAAGTRAAGRGDIGDWLGLILAGGVALRFASELWSPRQTTKAWRKGAEGEIRTARILERLGREYVIQHDLVLPGTRANIDHLVIGPTGIFTVETKNYSDPVKVARGRVTCRGRSMERIVVQARAQSEAAGKALERRVIPLVCVVGAGVKTGVLRPPVVNGVRFCNNRRLVSVINRGPAILSGAEVGELAATCLERMGR